MKFSKFGRPTLAAVLSLGLTAAFTACGRTGYNNTVDYVYVTNSKNNPGEINVYYADANSGGLTQISDSPYPTGGRNPVGLVTSPDFKYLYVINHDENTIVEFGIGSDAKLYPQHTYNTPGTFPNAIAIDSTGAFLFVTDTYQPQYTAANPGPGALIVYPINSDGSLGAPVPDGNLAYYPLSLGQTNVLNPTAINVPTLTPVGSTAAAGTFVYVTSQNSATGLGEISAFSLASSGTLTPLTCSASSSDCDSSGNGNFSAGTTPSAITSTPLGRYVYMTDSTRNQLFSYTVQPDGQIVPTPDSPAKTDVFPDAVTVDPHGEYVYVANYTANSISAFAIGSAGVTPVGFYGTGTGPTCVFVEPALGSYVYTTNFLDNTVSGFNLDLNSGALAPVQNSPFLANGQPTCVAASPHKTHPAITSAN
jgi:6-phosphogluconolactonase (cycloisomerase 2 family)